MANYDNFTTRPKEVQNAQQKEHIEIVEKQYPSQNVQSYDGCRKIPARIRRRFYAKRNAKRTSLPDLSGHKQITVSNVEIKFPFEPYPTQRDFMGACIQALNNRENALLESPTGTGKTLSLLCGTLAWREAFLDSTASLPAAEHEIIQIIYASRTHAQLAQAFAELRRTAYGADSVIGVLGSREQFCVNPNVLHASNSANLMRQCKVAVRKLDCSAYNKFSKLALMRDSKLLTAVDVEDLINNRLARVDVCPFHTMRHIAKTADVLFMPYPYLLDLVTRSRSSALFNLKNAVVIVDEGHNIAETCELAASFEFHLRDFKTASDAVGAVVKKSTSMTKEKQIADVQLCQKLLNKMFDQIQLLECTSTDPTQTASLKDLMTFARQAGMSYRNIAIVLQTLDDLSRLDEGEEDNLADPVVDEEEPPTDAAADSSPVLSNASESGILRLTRFLKTLFFPHCSDTSRQKSDFPTDVECAREEAIARRHYSPYVITIIDLEDGRQLAPQANRGAKRRPPTDKLFVCRCMSPFKPLAMLLNSGIRSLIVTSGTLSPMDALASELGVRFNVRLSCRHVIESRQISALIVAHVPRGMYGLRPENSAFQLIPLTADFSHRNSKNHICSLGNAVLRLLHLIPAGVLVFFPSYSAMSNCVRAWQEFKILNAITAVKTVFIEERNRLRFQTDLADYRQTVQGIVMQHQDNSKKCKLTGAVYFAVCRGKMSEGIDFPDDCARGVIVIGIPFGHVGDERVMLKRHYLDQCPTAKGALACTSRAWYEREAWVAVNQALGRVIRHRYDYGVCVMLDVRFVEEYERMQRELRGPSNAGYHVKAAKLPRYLQESVQPYTFEAAIGEVQRFFAENSPRLDLSQSDLAALANFGDKAFDVLDDGFDPPQCVPVVAGTKQQQLMGKAKNRDEFVAGSNVTAEDCPFVGEQQVAGSIQQQEARNSCGPFVNDVGGEALFNSAPLNQEAHAVPVSTVISAVNENDNARAINLAVPEMQNAAFQFDKKNDQAGRRKRRRNKRKLPRSPIVTGDDKDAYVKKAKKVLSDARQEARYNIRPPDRVWPTGRHAPVKQKSPFTSYDAPDKELIPSCGRLPVKSQQSAESRKTHRENARKCVESGVQLVEIPRVRFEDSQDAAEAEFGRMLDYLTEVCTDDVRNGNDKRCHQETEADQVTDVELMQKSSCDSNLTSPIMENPMRTTSDAFVDSGTVNDRLTVEQQVAARGGCYTAYDIIMQQHILRKEDLAADDRAQVAVVEESRRKQDTYASVGSRSSWLGSWWRKISSVIKK